MSKSGIVGILDLDGIRLGNKFYVRELAFTSMEGEFRVNQKFHLEKSAWRNASAKDRKTAFFVSSNITQLTVNAHPREHALPQQALQQFVLDFYKELPEQGKVGYKGGTVEFDLLHELGIPSLNIEVFGCPTYNKLSGEYSDLEKFNCGHHKHSDAHYHCSSMEIEAFKRWWNYNIDRWWHDVIVDCPIRHESSSDLECEGIKRWWNGMKVFVEQWMKEKRCQIK